MSKQSWAAIVYGRSYYLDFRFITIPQDFTTQEITWASPYILATTQQARNLASYPRWSLFKNDTHCIVGVTCMVRDLVDKREQDLLEVMSKDDRGRPLYIFVGYATQLKEKNRRLTNLPAYQGKQLTVFQPLYREIERVWLAKEYEKRQPGLSQYQILDSRLEITTATANDQTDHLGELSINSQSQSPHQTFLWSKSLLQNRQLWLASAQCGEATSICLDIQGKYLFNSPFLNQTASKIEQFTIKDRMIAIEESNSSQPTTSMSVAALKHKISSRAKEDLDLSLQQAAKVSSASQKIITNLNPWNDGDRHIASSNITQPEQPDSFGFKAKSKSSRSQQQEEDNEPLGDSEFPSSNSSKQQDWF